MPIWERFSLKSQRNTITDNRADLAVGSGIAKEARAMTKGQLESYIVGRLPMKVGSTTYEPGDFVLTLGDVSEAVRQQLVDSHRIYKVMVVSQAKFRQLERASA